MNENLPKWVYDLIMELQHQEDVHPGLYMESRDFMESEESYVPYDWCPCIPLRLVPDEVLAQAKVLKEYNENE